MPIRNCCQGCRGPVGGPCGCGYFGCTGPCCVHSCGAGCCSPCGTGCLHGARGGVAGSYFSCGDGCIGGCKGGVCACCCGPSCG